MSNSQNEGEGAGDKASKKKDSQDEDDSASENSKKKKNNKSMKDTNTLEDDTGDDVSVPEGWTRKAVARKSGKTCGRQDIYFFSPEGQKFRSRTEIAQHLVETNSQLQIDEFVFNVRTKGSNDIPKEKPKKRKAATSAPSKAKKGKEARSTVAKKSPRKFFAELTPPKDTNRTTVAKKQPKRIFVKLFASPKKRILSDFANESHVEEEPDDEEEEEEEEEEQPKAKARSPPKRGQAKKSPPPKAKPKGKPLKPATRVLASPKKGKKRKGAKEAKTR